MLKRKKIDYKIKKNDTSYFVRLGNVFPTYFEQQAFYSFFPTKTKSLLDSLLNSWFPIQENITKQNMFCLEYFSKSKSKTLSNIFCDLIDLYNLTKINEYYVPNDLILVNLGVEIEYRFLDKWTRLINVYKSEYDAIKPYVMTVTEEMEHQEKGATIETKGGNITDVGSNAKSGNDTVKEDNSRTHSGDDQREVDYDTNNSLEIVYSGEDTKSGTDTETGSETNKKLYDNTTNQLKGFNSSSFVDSDKSTNESEDTNTRNSSTTKNDSVTYNSKDSHTDIKDENTLTTDRYNSQFVDDNTETTTYGSRVDLTNTKTLNTTDTVNHGKGFDNTREITRLGNIGNTSQQELIMKEFELRKIQIIDIIYKDIDSVLTRSKYI